MKRFIYDIAFILKTELHMVLCHKEEEEPKTSCDRKHAPMIGCVFTCGFPLYLLNTMLCFRPWIKKMEIEWLIKVCYSHVTVTFASYLDILGRNHCMKGEDFILSRARYILLAQSMSYQQQVALSGTGWHTYRRISESIRTWLLGTWQLPSTFLVLWYKGSAPNLIMLVWSWRLWAVFHFCILTEPVKMFITGYTRDRKGDCSLQGFSPLYKTLSENTSRTIQGY